ncbi:hypothetical protein PI124_g15042 [Phytophthora idaei]|nr:hypothetical protein PI125_g12889 [Phytophthora idaei]KAG3153130.1 hypothetical protein PI126_g10206 [Phytophthora idaei]KAG3240045.1 hypothetical protein PI124_g15042 [Phytophthora idaei]
MPASIFSKCWKHTGLLDYHGCDYELPDEEDSITDELTAMMARLHAKDPMAVEELLSPPDENVTVDEPTDEDFCSMVVEESTSEGYRHEEAASDDHDDVEDDPPYRDRAKDLSVEEFQERLQWVAKLFINADAMSVPPRALVGPRTMHKAFREELARKRGRKQEMSLLTFFSRPEQNGQSQ